MFCGCIAGKTIQKCISTIKKAQADGANLIELRIDYLIKKEGLKKIISSCPLPIIATNRKGDQKILIDAINHGVKYIDMDINEINTQVLAFAKKKEIKVILSYHNYEDTPPEKELLNISKTLRQKGADIAKIIATPQSQHDNTVLLSLYSKTDFPLIAFGMGKTGMQTRLDCLAHGALWTYCSVDKNKTAPGQISLEQAKKKKLYCVIGNPIAHSLSPVMHNANFKSLNINAGYVGVQVTNLERYMNTVISRGLSGINVTIPHKVEVMKYLDEIDPLAEEIGAVNTILNKDGKLIGYNTDGYGAMLAIKEKMKNTEGKKIIILGSGGAARGIYFTLKKHKADVLILARNEEKGSKIGKCIKLDDRNLKTQLENADVLINCTPVGMNSNESIVPKEYLKKELVVFDIVYTPIKTRLAKDAESIGCPVILGYKMLAYQGAQSFKIWTGLDANIPTMTDAVLAKILPNIALVGFMGTGKTSVGKRLAENMNRTFIDLDKEIEREAKLSITEIFEKYGEAHFRKLEKNMLKKTLSKNRQVISCGGGIVLDEKNRNLLKSYLVVLLKAKPETIAERLKEDNDRPLLKLNNEEKINKIKQILDERQYFYNDVADYSINTDNCIPKEIARKIIESINNDYVTN